MQAEERPAFYTLPADRVAAQLGRDTARALARREEVARRRALYGSNSLPETSRRSPLRMLAGQFADFMILLLIAAAVLPGFIGAPSRC